MKLILLLLSVLVMTLTVVPCCALENSEFHFTQQIEKESGPKEHKNHKVHEDDDDCCKDCSPFYVCGTCIGFTTTSSTSYLFINYTRPTVYNSVYILMKAGKVVAAIWQPPKLS